MASKPNLLLMRTFSKIYGLAGLRIGYGIGHPDFIAALEKIRQPFNINMVAQAGALAALDDTKHVEKTRKVNSRGLRLYARTFRKLGLELFRRRRISSWCASATASACSGNCRSWA